MKEGMKNWIAGVSLFGVIATIIYGIGVYINPYLHFSWLESFGLVMMGITLKTGIDTYNEDNEEN